MTPLHSDAFVGARILAVDDDEAKRYAWDRILSRAGFSVFTASTGEEALARCRENPDLIILDIRLPDMNGMDVCRKIKEAHATSSIPVLHISASLVTPEDRTAALEGGADGYLTEPVDPEELVASVKALLRMRRAEEEARRAAAEWQTTFDTIQDGIVVANAQGVVVRCNQAFLSLSGKTKADVTGTDLSGLVKRLEIPGIDSVQAVVDGKCRQSAELAWRNRWIRVTLDPIEDGAAASGSICILSDVTEQKAAELKVQELNSSLEARVAERTRRLESAIRELEAYSYTIAHDLRAPLRAIHRFSEILLDEFGPGIGPQGADYARRIVAGAEKMDALINGLLEYSRLTQSEVVPQLLAPGTIVSDVLRTLLSDSSARVPEVHVDEPLPEVYGDKLLLQQVFQNLISNALKFVKKDVTPKVRVSGERKGDRIELSVSDNGVGIPFESQGRLFRVFERLENAQDYPGTGIGLAIVRRAVERMGGECGVTSDVAMGSRFWCRLPAVRPTAGGLP